RRCSPRRWPRPRSGRRSRSARTWTGCALDLRRWWAMAELGRYAASAQSAGAARDAAGALVDFVCAVRRAGVPASPDRVPALAAAVDALGPAGLYWAGRLTLCGTLDDLPRYDAAYRAWTGGRPVAPPARRLPAGPPRRYAVPFGRDGE